jgi:hypothetical protein
VSRRAPIIQTRLVTGNDVEGLRNRISAVPCSVDASRKNLATNSSRNTAEQAFDGVRLEKAQRVRLTLKSSTGKELDIYTAARLC